MYKLYFKQAIQMLKQNKLISIISIIGTALAIMMIMVIIVTDSIKNTSISPETNRSKTLYLMRETKKSKEPNGWSSSNSIEYSTYKEYLADLKTPVLSTLVHSWAAFELQVAVDSKQERIPLSTKMTDADYWQFMSFSFVEGAPYTQEEFVSGIRKAVLAESAARKLFGKESALKKNIDIDFMPYEVVGVVKDVSPVFKYCHASIYIPYTSRSDYKEKGYGLLLLSDGDENALAIENEIRECERKFNVTDAEANLTLIGPFSHKVHQLPGEITEPNVKKNRYKTIFILAVLLLIPAINLSSFSMSQIKKRTEEIGIRKAFGAKKHIILVQVLYENLITSFIGGIIGLVLSYGVVYWLKDWLLEVDPDSSLPLATFVTLPVFGGVFVVCILLNLISASLPAIRASRITIIDSLNRNNL